MVNLGDDMSSSSIACIVSLFLQTNALQERCAGTSPGL